MESDGRVLGSRWSVVSPGEKSPFSRVHVVGIAGSGLRGMAQLLRQKGATISGSDMHEGPVVERLRRSDIDCRIGHAAANVSRGVELVVISAAVDPSNPEVRAAHSRRIPVLKYSECLGQLMGEKLGVGVAGTHGKTTTTAMAAGVLDRAGLDPSFLVGGECPGLGGSARWGSGRHFVVEACEFDRSFLNLRPHCAVVTNVDEDHLDYFGSMAEIRRAFGEFVSMIPSNGMLVLNQADPATPFLRERSSSAISSFGLDPGASDWWAQGLEHSGPGYEFEAVHRGGERVRIALGVPGLHNVRNALATVALCRYLGVSLDDIAGGLEAFRGVRRRFDVLKRDPVTVIDDYAHHPTEIEAVLGAARMRLPGRRLVAVFQPHQHSRLKRFESEFGRVLAGFDDVLVLDVFRSRDSEEDARNVSSRPLAELLVRAGAEVVHTPGFADAHAELRRRVNEGDAVLFLGAGSVTDLARQFADTFDRGTFERSESEVESSLLSA